MCHKGEKELTEAWLGTVMFTIPSILLLCQVVHILPDVIYGRNFGGYYDPQYRLRSKTVLLLQSAGYVFGVDRKPQSEDESRKLLYLMWVKMCPQLDETNPIPRRELSLLQNMKDLC